MGCFCARWPGLLLAKQWLTVRSPKRLWRGSSSFVSRRTNWTARFLLRYLSYRNGLHVEQFCHMSHFPSSSTKVYFCITQFSERITRFGLISKYSTLINSDSLALGASFYLIISPFNIFMLIFYLVLSWALLLKLYLKTRLTLLVFMSWYSCQFLVVQGEPWAFFQSWSQIDALMLCQCTGCLKEKT